MRPTLTVVILFNWTITFLMVREPVFGRQACMPL